MYMMPCARMLPANGTWARVTQTIELLHRYGVECNLLCVVTKQLAKKAERVYKSMKATGVRYLQFIPCLDPLGMPQGQQNYSLTPELYARFLCALFDAWYRDWKTSTYVSVRLFEDYIHLLMGGPAVTCSTTGTLRRAIWSWRVAVRCTRATFSAWMPTNSEPCKTTPCNRCLPAKKCGRLSRTAGRSPQSASNADGSTCAAAAASVTAIAADKAQRSYYCKALQKFFAYAEPRLCEMVRAVQMYR